MVRLKTRPGSPWQEFRAAPRSVRCPSDRARQAGAGTGRKRCAFPFALADRARAFDGHLGMMARGVCEKGDPAEFHRTRRRVSRCRSGHPFPARHQSGSQGDVSDHR